jgi:hypothetical protein
VPELGELVELELREPDPDAREALVVVHRERDAGRRVVHLAELEHPQLAAAVADPRRPVEDRAARLEPDRERDDREDRRQREQRERGDRHVDRPLGHPVHAHHGELRPGRGERLGRSDQREGGSGRRAEPQLGGRDLRQYGVRVLLQISDA